MALPRGLPGVSEEQLEREQNGPGDDAQIILPAQISARARAACARAGTSTCACARACTASWS